MATMSLLSLHQNNYNTSYLYLDCWFHSDLVMDSFQIEEYQYNGKFKLCFNGQFSTCVNMWLLHHVCTWKKQSKPIEIIFYSQTIFTVSLPSLCPAASFPANQMQFTVSITTKLTWNKFRNEIKITRWQSETRKKISKTERQNRDLFHLLVSYL